MKLKHFTAMLLIVLGSACVAQPTSINQTATTTFAQRPETLKKLYLDAKDLRESGQLDAALNKAENLLSLLPANQADNREATLFLIGRIHEDAKRFEKAALFYQELLGMEEKRLSVDHLQLSDTLFFLAGSYVLSANYSEAEKVYIRLIDIRQKSGRWPIALEEPLYALANLYHLQDRIDDTERVVRGLIDLVGKHFVQAGIKGDYSINARQSLGAVMLRRGNIKEAIRLHLDSQTRIDLKFEEAQASSFGIGQGILELSIECLDRLARLHQLDQNQAEAKQFSEKAQSLRSRLPAKLINVRRPLSWGQSILPLEPSVK